MQRNFINLKNANSRLVKHSRQIAGIADEE